MSLESKHMQFGRNAVDAIKSCCVQSSASVPLCVDLDGTLVKSDTLVDSAVVLARQNFRMLTQFPQWLMQGKAAFKRNISSAVKLDVAHLPYNQRLLEYLREQRTAGREIYLATGADAKLAERVAAHLGIFAGVLASDGKINLIGQNKLDAFQQRFPEGFSYIGNARPDLPLLTHCIDPMVANASRSLRAGLRTAGVQPARRFNDSAPLLKTWLRAIRLHQWAKNTLIFLPLLLAHVHAAGPGVASLLAFLSFGLAASATYLFNDLLDLEADRHHPRKRARPFAAGEISPIAGVATILLFFASSLAIALLLPHTLRALSPQFLGNGQGNFLEWLVIYAILTTAYSLWLKRMVLVDVIVLSGLYTLRILAGSAAAGVMISPWLAAFSIFFFLSLAFVKRFAELESMSLRNPSTSSIAVKGRGYRINDLEQLRSFGTASGYASVMVFLLYIGLGNLGSTTTLYRHSTRLWLLAPVLLLWISRLWIQASRGELHEDPVVYAITDKHSLQLGVLVVAIVLSAL